MIGVVVVTHGQLATELVNAAEMIVGDLPQFTAVSIGWHDEVNDAREDIAQAIERVRGEAGVLLLTDMFGGTPSNLGMTFLETDRVEVITGVNLPMLIKLASLRRSSDLLAVAQGDARSRAQRDLGGLGPAARGKDQCVDGGARSVQRASPSVHARRMRTSERPMTSQAVTVVNQLGMHARAAAKFVHLATRFQSQRRVAREGREMDGKSIMGILLLAAARGSTITISADGHDERDAVDGAGRRWSNPDSARTHAAPEGHRRVAGRRLRPRGHPDPARAGAALPDRRRRGSSTSSSRLDESRVRSREQLVDIRARVAQRRPELASLFDAQLLMLDDPMLVPRAADIVREQRVNAEWAVQQVFHEFSAVFDEVADPYLRERKGDVADLVGPAADEPAPGRRDAARPAARARRVVGARSPTS